MINAKELRIGNWVNYTSLDGETVYLKINEISKNDDFEDCDPIPLTPEILERAGFGKEIIDGWVNFTIVLPKSEEYTLYATFSNSPTELQITLPQKEDEDEMLMGAALLWRNEDAIWSQVFLNAINYLHQLQNIYFSLTGKELQVNLTAAIETH